MTTGSGPASDWLVRWGERILTTRWMVRAPIWLFRAGLGFLFGGRLLLLEHIGRTSGLTRYVALEVVARPSRDSFVVASGFGEKAQWYRNVMAHPRVRVRWSSRAAATAVARRLGADEARVILRAYAEEHPRAWAKLIPVFEATLGAPIGGESSALPLIRFDLTVDEAEPARVV